MSGSAEAAAAASSAASVADDSPGPTFDDSACSTPFVSAPSSPTRGDLRDPYPAHFFFSAPTSPTRGGTSAAGGGTVLDFDFDFDFSSRFPSPSAAAMSSADELFHNGQIRPVRLSAALLQPHPDTTILLDFPATTAAAAAEQHEEAEEEDERGRRGRSRSVRRKARSMSPFRTHWRTASHAPAAAAPVLETESVDETHPVAAALATPAASRSSSSSSTASSASSASSSSSRGSRRWGGFLKDLLHRSKSDGGKPTTNHQHSHGQHSAAGPPAPHQAAAAKAASAWSPSPSPSPAMKGVRGCAATGHRGGGGVGGGRRRSAHERLYEARRAEAEEMRRRTSLPYRQGLLLFGCIGLGNRGAVHGLARGLNAVSSRS